MNPGRNLGSERAAGPSLAGSSFCCKNPASGVLSVSLAGLEEVWGVVLQRAAQVHHTSEEQQQSPGAAGPALAG